MASARDFQSDSNGAVAWRPGLRSFWDFAMLGFNPGILWNACREITQRAEQANQTGDAPEWLQQSLNHLLASAKTYARELRLDESFALTQRLMADWPTYFGGPPYEEVRHGLRNLCDLMANPGLGRPASRKFEIWSGN
jgi:hypothetical protein